MHLITGDVVTEDTAAAVHSKCAAGEDFPDVTTGAQVTVYDQRGTVIAVGPLGAGHTTQGAVLRDGACRWPFSISGVPTERAYGVEVANRGQLHYTLAQMEAQSWRLSLTLR